MNKRQKFFYKDQNGSAMLMTAVILLILSLIIASSLTLAGMTLDIAVLKRNTSNTYYLAESAVLKQVDTMNKALENEIAHIIESQISTYYISELVSGGDGVKHNTKEHILEVDKEQDDLLVRVKKAVYDYLVVNYVGEDIGYKVQSDRSESDYATQVKIEVSNLDEVGETLPNDTLRVIATAMTQKEMEVYDQQTVEALVKIDTPTEIKNQIHEKYEWNHGVPEQLRSSLLCYSDVLVKDAGNLRIDGDVRVGGKPNIEGNITGETITYPEVDQTGGVIAINGGQIEFNDNVYCTRNILATNGWGKIAYDKATSIHVGKDAIAHTIGIIDDFYEEGANQEPYTHSHQVQNVYITIGQNAMTDNDVMIDRWVKGGIISIKKTLFGVGGGTTNLVTNPNQSSGVFARGEKSMIEAGRMYVAGQPFIIFEGHHPIRLWESIGEPFDGLASWFGYKEGKEQAENETYLDEDSPFATMISASKIRTNLDHTFALAKVSAINTKDNSQNRGVTCQKDLGNPIEAWQFFFQQAGANGKKIEDLMDSTTDAPVSEAYKNEVNQIISRRASDYLGGKLKGKLSGTKEAYCRDLGPVLDHTYEGLKGYMSLMRAILYQTNTSKTKKELREASFAQIIDRGKLPSMRHKWCYETPIEVVDSNFKNVTLSDYYVDEGEGEKPYPTLIINGDESVTLKVSARGDRDTLKGWIISAGPVELGKEVKIEGGIIIKGPENEAIPRKEIYTGSNAGLIIKEGKVQITHNADVLLDIQTKDHALYRNILDALHLTNYSKEKTSEIIAKQVPYTEKALKYTDKSILEMDTEGIRMSVQSLKKK